MYKQQYKQKQINVQTKTYLSELILSCSSISFHENLINFIQSCSIPIFMSNIKLLSKIILSWYDRCKRQDTHQGLQFCQQLMTTLIHKKQYLFNHDKIFEFLLVKMMGQNKHQPKQYPNNSQLLQLSLSSESLITNKYSNNMLLQNPNPHPQTNQLIPKIVWKQVIVPNPNCLGCTPCYQGQQFQQTGQMYFVIRYDNNPTFDNDFRRAVCASINSGGAYIYLNKDSQNKIKGLQQSTHTENGLFNLLKSDRQWVMCTSYIQNKFKNLQRQQLVLQRIPVSVGPFMDHPTNPNQLKYILRVKVVPACQRICYIENQVKSNKITKKFFLGRNNRVVEVHSQHIYNLIMGSYLLEKTKPQIIKVCTNCNVRQSMKANKFLSSIQVQDQGEQQVPHFKYKNSTMLCISSTKFQEQIIGKVKQELKQKKILYFMNKPYRKYVTTAIRVIYFINHECQFDQINKAVRLVDTQNKTRCIIVTKFMQVKIPEKRQHLQKLQNIIFTNFRYYPPKQERCEKVSSTVSTSFAFYQFRQRQQAILAFIYFDNLSLRAQFVKEYFFKNQCKKKA